MKLICECGNEVEFKEELLEDEETEEDEEESDYGTYTTIGWDKFDHWAEHDESGFECCKCGKKIWYFS